MLRHRRKWYTVFRKNQVGVFYLIQFFRQNPSSRTWRVESKPRFTRICKRKSSPKNAERLKWNTNTRFQSHNSSTWSRFLSWLRLKMTPTITKGNLRQIFSPQIDLLRQALLGPNSPPFLPQTEQIEVISSNNFLQLSLSTVSQSFLSIRAFIACSFRVSFIDRGNSDTFYGGFWVGLSRLDRGFNSEKCSSAECSSAKCSLAKCSSVKCSKAQFCSVDFDSVSCNIATCDSAVLISACSLHRSQ